MKVGEGILKVPTGTMYCKVGEKFFISPIMRRVMRRVYPWGAWEGDLLVQRPPSSRTIFFAGGETLFLHFPFTAFILTFRVYNTWMGLGRRHLAFLSLRVGLSNKPVASLEDELVAPPLPHFGIMGHVCLGESFRRDPWPSLTALFDASVAYFWSSQFRGVIDPTLNYWKGMTREEVVAFPWDKGNKYEKPFPPSIVLGNSEPGDFRPFGPREEVNFKWTARLGTPVK